MRSCRTEKKRTGNSSVHFHTHEIVSVATPLETRGRQSEEEAARASCLNCTRNCFSSFYQVTQPLTGHDTTSRRGCDSCPSGPHQSSSPHRRTYAHLQPNSDDQNFLNLSACSVFDSRLSLSHKTQLRSTLAQHRCGSGA